MYLCSCIYTHMDSSNVDAVVVAEFNNTLI